MKTREKVKYVHHGQYVAEVTVKLLYDNTGWSPYLSLEDAYKLDDVKEALRVENLELAGRHARVFELHPVSGK